MLDASPKGTVPVLVTQSGLLEESLDIMVWALEQHDPDGWLRHKDRDLDTAARFHAAFKDRLDRYKYASRYDDSRARGDVDLTMRAEAVAVLAETFQPLSENGFLHGDTPSLIDVATFPFIRQFAAVEPDWWAASAPPGVKPWLDSWINSDRFKRVMHKHPVWTPPT
jgi:glutathione S-transferase